MAKKLSHFDSAGRPLMVDVSDKPESARSAVARGRVRFSAEAYKTIKENGVKKGDIRTIAELAGVQGAKRTADLIPLCHPISITGLKVAVEHDDASNAFMVTAEVKTTGKTGVEMEAMTAVATACLTIYDMAKAIDKSIVIEELCLMEKSGGKSGDFRRDE